MDDVQVRWWEKGGLAQGGARPGLTARCPYKHLTQIHTGNSSRYTLKLIPASA